MNNDEKLIKGSTELNQMFAALQRTADGLRRDFGEVENLQQSLSSARRFVKTAAERIEEMIISDLALVRPHAGLSTPNVHNAGDGGRADRDEFALALSGAENFVRGIAHFAITLALRVNGETKVGLVYSPIEDVLFYAEAGDGAFLFSPHHSQRLAVSKNTDGFGRDTGCPALDLAFVAAGKYDRVQLPPLDMAELAAGELLVSEAGGTLAFDNGNIVASNNLNTGVGELKDGWRETRHF